jgi:hypothetical protein
MKKHQLVPDTQQSIDFDAQPSIPLGQVIVTDAAIDVLDRAGLNASQVLALHVGGAWRDFSFCDESSNELALVLGLRLFSVYRLGVAKAGLWVITDPD